MYVEQKKLVLVVDENIGTLEISVQEIFGMTVLQRFYQLPSKTTNMLVCEIHHLGV